MFQVTGISSHSAPMKLLRVRIRHHFLCILRGPSSVFSIDPESKRDKITPICMVRREGFEPPASSL